MAFVPGFCHSSETFSKFIHVGCSSSSPSYGQTPPLCGRSTLGVWGAVPPETGSGSGGATRGGFVCGTMLRVSQHRRDRQKIPGGIAAGALTCVVTRERFSRSPRTGKLHRLSERSGFCVGGDVVVEHFTRIKHVNTDCTTSISSKARTSPGSPLSARSGSSCSETRASKCPALRC